MPQSTLASLVHSHPSAMYRAAQAFQQDRSRLELAWLRSSCPPRVPGNHVFIVVLQLLTKLTSQLKLRELLLNVIGMLCRASGEAESSGGKSTTPRPFPLMTQLGLSQTLGRSKRRCNTMHSNNHSMTNACRSGDACSWLSLHRLAGDHL